ncbi:baseplate assembly protein [Verminephrobacter aporrectodeae subsp. tuberculatae]|uniref:Baseplate assembly protein n=1 Tax=Verminephrobacter aporrectodeae subsp. tuberculatae TaxID=1110392 RepID=A0ABT3KNA7_9BURK|nr:baseplate J/gp47 family protein [Verminephrobacter aporrectodeae]MCW5319627.1 baseplate assembly protein [Verminephrobacter aporrectodeae subsp. tuberculatae]
MSRRIDLSRIAPPEVVESLAFETIYQEMKDAFRRLHPQWTASLESDPVVKLLEVAAYREMLVRARVNDAARAVMLAYAGGSDLEHLAVLLGVTRLEGETDTRLRTRTQLSLEGFSTAGPALSYVFHALSASQEVRDVTVSSPEPGRVRVVVLAEPSATHLDGVPDAALIRAVDAKVSAEDVRPLTDQVSVVPAQVILYSVRADLQVASGPDAQVVLTSAQAALDAYVQQQFGLGRDVTVSGLHAALHQAGVTRVDLIEPTASKTIEPHQAARCSGTTVRIAGVMT